MKNWQPFISGGGAISLIISIFVCLRMMEKMGGQSMVPPCSNVISVVNKEENKQLLHELYFGLK